MREDLKAARHLLNDALPWLKTYDEIDDAELDQLEMDAAVLGHLISSIEALPPFRV
jgi:hypothetical protein